MAKPRHQEGTLKKLKDCWQGHFYTYDSEGKRHHRSVTLGSLKKTSKSEAQRQLETIIEKETSQPTETSGADTLEWFWANRFAPFQAWGEVMRLNMESVFRIHIAPKIGKYRLRDIDKYQIQILLQGMSGYSVSLLKKVRTCMRLVMSEALDADVISKDPVRKVKIVGGNATIKRALSLKEFQLLMTELSEQDRLILMIALSGGLRPAELFALKWEDLDVARQRIRVDETFARGRWKETKTRASNAWVTLPKAVINQLLARKVQQEPGELIFASRNGTPMEAGHFVEHKIKTAAIRAGIMQERPKGLAKGTQWTEKQTAVNFQVCRRSCATFLTQITSNVKDAQSHLRHTDPSTTMTYYIQETPDSVRSGVEQLFTFLSTPETNVSIQ